MNLIDHTNETYRNTLREAASGLQTIIEKNQLNGEQDAIKKVGLALEHSAEHFLELDGETRKDIEQLYDGLKESELYAVLSVTGQALQQLSQRPSQKQARELYPFIQGFIQATDLYPHPIVGIMDSFNYAGF